MNCCKISQLITWMILLFSMLLVWVWTVELLWKRNSPCAVIVGENPTADWQLVTTCVWNTIFYLFPHIIGGIMLRKLPQHVLQQTVLLWTKGNYQCEVAIIHSWFQARIFQLKSCGAIDSSSNLYRRSMGVDRGCLHPVETVICFLRSRWTVSFVLPV